MRAFVLALLLVLAVPCSASAVIVTFKTDRPPIKGYMVRQDASLVVVSEPLPDGKLRTHELKRSDIESLTANVSAEKLAALRAERPQEYFAYAQTLSKQADDPEARDEALRLFLIAAYLDPAAHAVAALQAMAPLAENDDQRKRFRAMAYLLDPAHDRGLIQHASPPAAAADSSGGSAALLNAVRMLRRGERSDALAIAQRPVVAEQLQQYSSVLSPAEFAAAAEAVCPACKKGLLPCPRCQGEGRRRIGGTVRRCPDCNGTGGSTCVLCGGNYHAGGLSGELLVKVLRLELLLSRSNAATDQLPSGAAGSWAVAVAEGGKPAAALSLETITKFDPRKHLYLRGRWVEP